MIFKRKKKKELSVEQYRTRFYIGIGLVLVMILVCLLPRRRPVNGPPAGTPAAVMQLTVDSLLVTVLGPGATLERADPVDRFTEKSKDEVELENLKARLDILTQLSQNGTGIQDETMEELLAEIGRLEDISRDSRRDTVFVRRIYAAGPDGRRFTAFQKLDATLRHATLQNVVELRQEGNAEEKIEEMLKNNNEE